MLDSRVVFIDTQYFVKTGLHFDNPALNSFKNLCADGELRHLTTNLVRKEVEAKISESVKDALSSIQNFKRKAKILSNIDDDNIRCLFSDVNEEDVYYRALLVYSEFLAECDTEFTDENKVNVTELTCLYFDQKPPFGKAKKKNEFPDAISLLSLKAHTEEKIYVVSEDLDLISFCEKDESLIVIDSLDKVLDIYNNHENHRAVEVKKYFELNEEKIKDEIKVSLEGYESYNTSSWEDAEVDGFKILSISDIEPTIISIDDESCQLTFDIYVEFEVSVTGPDYNNGYYDREDDRVYTFDSTTNVVCEEKEFSVEILLDYEIDEGKLANPDISEMIIHGVSGGIEFSVEENEESWY